MELAGVRDEDFYTDDEVIEMLARQKELNFAPGGEYLYSNTGYYLLGVIVKRVSGQPLRKFANEHIFRPLEDGKLHIKHRNAPEEPLRPALSDMFWMPHVTLLFTRDEAGQVSGFVLQAGRVRNIRFARV